MRYSIVTPVSRYDTYYYTKKDAVSYAKDIAYRFDHGDVRVYKGSGIARAEVARFSWCEDSDKVKRLI